jgi:hypothetical protein
MTSQTEVTLVENVSLKTNYPVKEKCVYVGRGYEQCENYALAEIGNPYCQEHKHLYGALGGLGVKPRKVSNGVQL